MPSTPLPPGMNPLEYGTMLMGGVNRSTTDPFVLQRNLQAQQQLQAEAEDPEAQAQAMLEQVQQTLKETSASNKLKETALKLKAELDKARELEGKLQADPEAAALLEQLTVQEEAPPEAAPPGTPPVQ